MTKSGLKIVIRAVSISVALSLVAVIATYRFGIKNEIGKNQY